MFKLYTGKFIKFINKFIKIEIFFFKEKNRILVNLLFSIKACQFKLVIEKVNKSGVHHTLLFFKVWTAFKFYTGAFIKFISKFIEIEIFFFEEKNRILVNLLFSIKACQFKLVIVKVNKSRVQHTPLFLKVTEKLHYLIICLNDQIFQYTCNLFDFSII